MNAKFMDKLNVVIGKLNESKIIKAMMGGMMIAMPAIMAGSVATILLNLQIGGYQDFITSTGISDILNVVTIVTVNFTALYTVFGIAYNYTKEKGYDAVPAGILGLTAFFLMTPLNTVDALGDGSYLLYMLPTSWLGAQGVFSAMIIGIVTAMIYSFAIKKNLVIKLPDTVPPVISSSFSAIIPGVLVIGFFAVCAFIFSLTPFGSMHQAIYSVLQAPIQSVGGNIWSLLLVVFLGQVLWLFGIHGPMVIMSLAMVAWRPLDLANLAAYNAGTPASQLPNIVGFGLYQLTTFAGGGIGLAICFLMAKSKRYKALGKLSIVPSAFGITEPLIFGAPIVMNFKLAIPHVFLPMLSAVLGYFAITTGILPRMNGISLPTGTPIGIFGFLQAGLPGLLFQLFLIVIWVIGYYPFVRSLDKEAYALEQQTLNTESK